GLATGHGDDGAAEALGTVVCTETAGEEAVAVGVVNLIAGFHSGGAHAAGYQGRPHFDVIFGVGHGRWLTGGSRRSVDAADLVHWYRQSLERVRGPQEFFVDSGEQLEVRKLFEVLWVHAVAVVQLFIRGNVIVCVVEGPAKTLVLQRFNFVTTIQFL